MTRQDRKVLPGRIEGRHYALALRSICADPRRNWTVDRQHVYYDGGKHQSDSQPGRSDFSLRLAVEILWPVEPATELSNSTLRRFLMESKAKLVGHPVHQMLVVFPLGLLATAVAFDLIGMWRADMVWS